MGKYMRKAKLTGDMVAVMDVSQSSLGVRTRAKTLALQKLQASKSTNTPPLSPAAEQRTESSYLQLRSRRLEKPPHQQLTCCRQQNPNPSFVTSDACDSVGTGSIEAQGLAGEETEGSCYVGALEASFGENSIEFDGRERSTRESTPCSLIRDLNAISTPDSRTFLANLEASNRMTHNSVIRNMPLAQEIEEFFAHHEQEQERRFAEKYNFDIVNENPLEGRYEWVRVHSQ